MVKKTSKKATVRKTKETIVRNIAKEYSEDFLNLYMDTLKKDYPDLKEARFEDDPPRIVLVLNSLREVVPITHKGMTINTVAELVEDKAVVLKTSEDMQGGTPENQGPSNSSDVVYRDFSGDVLDQLNMEEAVSPHSKSKDSDAYRKWLVRHKNTGRK